MGLQSRLFSAEIVHGGVAGAMQYELNVLSSQLMSNTGPYVASLLKIWDIITYPDHLYADQDM